MAKCPWRLGRGTQSLECDSFEARHRIHYAQVPTPTSWSEDEPGAHKVAWYENEPGANRYEITPMDRCANLECPNRAHEGKMTLMRVYTAGRGVSRRDVTLLLCAPCADIMSVMLR
jgi:hypothetical protein